MVKYLYFDLETTGTYSSQHAIHQLAGKIVIEDKNGFREDKMSFDLKLKPFDGAKIEPKALEVGGISYETIMSYPNHQEAYKAFIAALSQYVDRFDKEDKLFLVGYNNASFDNDFLRNLFFRNGDKYFGSWFWADPIDIRVLAAEHLREIRHTMKDFKLKTVAAQLGIKVEEHKLHEAGYDIYLTEEIHKIIRESK